MQRETSQNSSQIDFCFVMAKLLRPPFCKQRRKNKMPGAMAGHF
jgi:hypothetical protein